ncbi:MAG: efflux RND transporter permease subunit [Acidiferrobacterales bacterium]
MRAFIRFLVDRDLIVNLISVFLLLLGSYAIVAINREAFPNVNLDRVQINAAYPGASPEEVERLLVTPIEQELKSLSGIDKMTSIAFPGSARIELEVDPNASNRDRIAGDVQLAVSRATLPQDLPYEPAVLEIDGGVFPILQLAISAPRSDLELKRLGDKIRDDVLDIKGVGRVIIQGNRKAEIRVVVDPEKLRQQRISIGEISSALASWNVNAPGGDLETSTGQKAVRISGEFKDASDVASLVLRANELGQGLRLGDIASVTESLEKAQMYVDVQGKPAAAIIIMKKSDADIITIVDEIREYIKKIPELYGQDVSVDTFLDMSKFARMRLRVLTNNGIVGIILVFLTLILFLRPSVAMTTTWGLPIVFFAGLYALFLSGVTLNLISMMGFIIVLGMIVDDAIIIGENITYHMEQGMAPKKAATVGAMELLGPVTATVMTTIAAFLPMMFMSGMIGKFIVAIPIVVSALLFFSWLESFLILPSHVAFLAKPKEHPKERKWLVKLEDAYGRLLEKALDHRYLTVALSAAILIGSFVLAGTAMKFRLFPPSGVDQYMVRVTAPGGTSYDTMRNKLARIDGEIRKRINPEYFESTVVTTGQIARDGGDPLVQRGGRFGQINVVYTPAVARPDHNALDDMNSLARDLPPLFPELDIAFTEIAPGPPTGRPLEVEISGSDDAATERTARRLMALLKDAKGVTSVESGLLPGDDELHVVLDRTLATYAGVDLITASRHVRAAVGGLRVSTIRRGTEEIDITIRYPDSTRDPVKMLKGLLLPNKRGGLVPLSRIAKLVEKQGYTTIRHRAGIRTVSVLANINSDVVTSVEINKWVADKQPQWTGDDASKVTLNYGGESEKNEESIGGLVRSFGFALIAIFFILAIQFNNLKYPIIVMLAIPFGAVGIILSFLVHDILWKPMPLSFFALLGMVALAGVVVNSALILLVFFQRAMKEGMECRDAIVLAGRRRLRAVILTAATTVVGLLPTAYGWGGMDPFVSPMALALSWGLVFATLVTLITIPATLAVGIDVATKLGQLWDRLMPEGGVRTLIPAWIRKG